MSFEKDYNQLLSITQSVLNSRNIHIDAQEIVNHTYLYFIDNNITYSLQKFKDKILYIIIDYKNAEHKYTFEHHKQTQLYDELTCPKCKEHKPIGAFGYYMNHNRNEKIYTSWCTQCRTAYDKIRRKQPVYKKRHLQYKKNLRKRVREAKANYYLSLYKDCEPSTQKLSHVPFSSINQFIDKLNEVNNKTKTTHPVKVA